MYRIFGITIVALCLIQQSLSLEMSLYTRQNFQGSSYTCGGYCSFVGTGANDNIESAKITDGTCAILYVDSPPGGSSVIISAPEMENPNFGNLNNQLSSFVECKHTTRNLVCPPNTFVRKFNTLNKDYLSYFSAECFFSNSTTDAKATLKSHPDTPETPTSQICDPGAVRGLLYLPFYSFKHGPLMTSLVCGLGGNCNATGDVYCGEKQGVCGFTTQTEEHTNILLNVQPKCCDVGDPSALCIPEDSFVPILVCDCLESKAPTTCTYSQTVGVSTSTSMSTSTSTEYKFYAEMGVDAGVSIDGLSANFHSKMGTSKTTSFDWTTASSNTWSKSVTNKVQMDVPACMKSVLLQVVGTCSFYNVNVNQYKRIDTTCDGIQTETVGSLEHVLGRTPVSFPVEIKENNEVRRRPKISSPFRQPKL